MSITWHFSPESQPLLNSFLAVAVPDEKSRKWREKLRPKHGNESSLETQETDIIMIEEDEADSVRSKKLNPEENIALESNLIIETLESEPNLNLVFLEAECAKNPFLLKHLAEKASKNCIERICDSFFSKIIENQAFLENVYQTFLPAYLKRENSRYSIDLLDRARNFHPELFKSLVQTILQDPNIPTSVIHDYIMVNEVRKKELLNIIIETNLNVESFTCYILTLYTVYKDCTKDLHIQSYIYSCLLNNSSYCSNNRDYGRLLLAFLQAQKNYAFNIDLAKMQSIIEEHSSPFKRPCLNVYKEIVNK